MSEREMGAIICFHCKASSFFLDFIHKALQLLNMTQSHHRKLSFWFWIFRWQLAVRSVYHRNSEVESRLIPVSSLSHGPRMLTSHFSLCHSQVTFLYIANFPKLKLTHDSLIYTCSGSNVKVKWDYQEERAHAPLTKREHECVLFAFISTEAGGESGPRPRKRALDAKIKNADWLTQIVKRGRDREEMIRPGEPH